MLKKLMPALFIQQPRGKYAPPMPGEILARIFDPLPQSLKRRSRYAPATPKLPGVKKLGAERESNSDVPMFELDESSIARARAVIPEAIRDYVPWARIRIASPANDGHAAEYNCATRVISIRRRQMSFTSDVRVRDIDLAVMILHEAVHYRLHAGHGSVFNLLSGSLTAFTLASLPDREAMDGIDWIRVAMHHPSESTLTKARRIGSLPEVEFLAALDKLTNQSSRVGGVSMMLPLLMFLSAAPGALMMGQFGMAGLPVLAILPMLTALGALKFAKVI